MINQEPQEISLKSGECLMGYKGSSYLDSGYFYAPYIPMTQTPVVLDPNSFTPRKGILTRYGKDLLKQGASFYGRITADNFKEEWTIKPKKKKIWRDVTEPWEPSQSDNLA